MRRQLPDILPDFENIPQFDGANDDNANNVKKNSLKKPDGPQPYLSPTYTWGDAAEDRRFPNVIFI